MTGMCATPAQKQPKLECAVSAGQPNLKLNFRQRVGDESWYNEFAVSVDSLRNADLVADKTINGTSLARSGTRVKNSADARIAFPVGVASVRRANPGKGFLKSSGGSATTRVCAVIVTSGGA